MSSDEETDTMTEQQELVDSSDSIQVLSFVAALVVIMVNVYLRPIVSYLNDYEKHTTYTDKNISLISKLTMARVLNSSVVFLVVHLINSENMYKIGYLAYGATILIAGLLVITPTLNLIDFHSCRKACRKKIEKAKGEKCALTQK